MDYIKDSKVLKLLKMFSYEIDGSTNKYVQSLSEVTYKIYLLWKNMLIGNKLEKLVEFVVIPETTKKTKLPAKRSKIKQKTMQNSKKVLNP